MPKVLSESEAERFIVQLLSVRGRMTTREIEAVARKQGKRCPDETVLFLTKLRYKGRIRGELSQEKRGWLWWV